MTAPDDIRTQLERASTLIGDFRRSAEAGTAVDLTGLDGCVATTCEAIAALPAAQRPVFRDALVALLDDMNGLVSTLVARQQAVSDDLKGVSSRQRAVAAYGKGAMPNGDTAPDPKAK